MSRPGDFEVPLDDIRAEGNIRSFAGNDEAAKELLASVKAVGVLEPVLITARKGKPKYQLVAGFRRYSAACEAGLHRIPARVMGPLTAARVTAIRLTENFNRLDMNPMEEAHGVRDYMRQAKTDQASTAEQLGRSQAWVSFRLRFLDLPAPVQDMLSSRELPTQCAIDLLPYVGKNSDQFLIDAARVGCWKGNNSSFKAALAGGLKTLYHTSKSERPPDDGVCHCACTCCGGLGPHQPGVPHA